VALTNTSYPVTPAPALDHVNTAASELPEHVALNVTGLLVGVVMAVRELPSPFEPATNDASQLEAETDWEKNANATVRATEHKAPFSVEGVERRSTAS
jgi:hypothetical protein